MIALANSSKAGRLFMNPPLSATHPGYTQCMSVIIGVMPFSRSVATTES
ncbi:Uncharacterised protein [Mycobacteroides abscessus subsp. abscessus]|nr:Uncharacterised protein [Mycobacteroides abscessus subsp. abscessus]SKV69749.1 Uncharacterised protein [Mycobacteroides abscessus subsp. abscessus]